MTSYRGLFLLLRHRTSGECWHRCDGRNQPPHPEPSGRMAHEDGAYCSGVDGGDA